MHGPRDDHYVEALRRASAQIKTLMAEQQARAADAPIAVVGMGCRLPGGADNPERFWDLLARGGDAVADIPPERFDLDRWWSADPDAEGRIYVRQAALIDDVRGFDPAFFRITPAEAEALDPQQRLLLEVSWEAFEDAGIDIRRVAGSNTGVFLGLSNYDYIQAHVHSGDPARITSYSGSGVMFSTAAGRLSYFYDLHGPCVTLDTACSSSLVALDGAIKALRRRDCDMALAGGISLILSPDSMVALCKVRALAADGRSRAFDDAGSGYGRGEGCGLVVLKRLDDAMRDGDVVHAVLAGSAVNHDGRSNGLTAPNGLAQQAVIRAALADAGLEPDAIGYVEAHGTGTPLGDPIEFGALDAVFGRRVPGNPLGLGSVKTNIGHTEAAAGIAGLIKVILAMRHSTLPKSLHFDTPNRHIDWDAATISIVSDATRWPSDAPRAAGISSFGLSGTNAHLVVTAPPAPALAVCPSDSPVPPGDSALPYVVPLSAATPAALSSLATAWAEALAEGRPADLAAAAARRTPLRGRVVAIGTTAAELQERLRSVTPPTDRSDRAVGDRIAFLFTGQGAQYAGMGKALHAAEPVFRAAFDRCQAAIANALPLLALLDDDAALARTGNAQPVTFALQWALAELWASWGVRPAAVAGHSIGEFAAAAVAGALTPESAMPLVLARARGMQALPAGGAMMAVMAAADTVTPMLVEHGDRLAIAAINADTMVTVSGDAAALGRLADELAEQGIDTVPLVVSHAFHSPLMRPMLADFRTAAADIAPADPGIPFFSTVTGARLGATRLDADYWTRQITSPVRFAETLAALRADGIDRFLEIGPGDVLTGLARRGGAGLATASLRRGTDDATGMAHAAAALWCDGVDMDWAARAPRPAHHVAAPHYPFQRKPYWLDVAPLRPTSAPHPQEADAVTSQASAVARGGQIVDHLVTTLAAVTGFDPADIDPAQHLTDMGLDSLMMMKLGQAVERDYGVELKMSQLFKELGTLADIQDYLARHATRGPAAIAVTVPPETRPARIVPPTPSPARALPADTSSLFEQQLRAMSDMAERNLHSLTELARLQLAGDGGATAPAPQTEPQPQPQAKPPRPPAPAAVPVAAIRGINLAGATLGAQQQAFVEQLVARHVARTGASKALTRDSRAILADWKHTLSFWGQLKEAKYPIVSARSKGARITDVDGNVYIDVAMGMGVHFFGHAPDFIHDALKTQLDTGIELGTQSAFTSKAAALLAELTGTERVAFSNTGSEVVMVALRLARAATGRNRVVLFRNSYHGIFDGVLATEQQGETIPIGLGTPAGMIEDLVVLPYDDPASLDFIRAHGDSIAAVLVEPVQSRDPDLQPQGFLKALRHLTERSGNALIFDEMINGFRIAPGGARAWFGVDADMALYGKIVGGGMPIGVIAGRARFLDYIDGGAWDYGDRSGPQSAMIYFGGTFCRNPATMVATHAALRHMKAAGPALQDRATARTAAFCDRLNLWFERRCVPLRCKHFSSQWRLVPIGAADREPLELELLYLSLLVRGVYTWERRISFFSTEHDEADIAAVFDAITGAIEEIRAHGFGWSIGEYPDPQFTALTSPERRMYALAQRDGGELPYHLPQAFLIDGPLDIDRLEEAFRRVIRRHEALRTAFVTIDGETLASRIAEPRFAIERQEIAADKVDRCIHRFIRRFDLAQAPPIRVAVATIAPERHLLLADAHHIAVDGLSFDIVATELMAAYDGRTLDPVAYDARTARRAVDAGGEEARGETNAAFWRDTLADLPHLALPTDRPRPVDRDFAGGAILAHLPPDKVTQLKRLAKSAGTSLYIVLLAAWSGFLHRLSEQRDIAIGGAGSGREHPATAAAVGMFVNTLVFRTRPDPALTFAAHLAETARVALAAYDHGDYPFEAMAMLAPAPDAGRNPLFDTMLSYENASARSFRLDDLTFTAHDVTLDAAMFDLALEVTELDGKLTLRFAYATALFDRATIDHWAADFVRMLDTIVNDPDRPLGRLDIQSTGEQALIAAFNDTAATYPDVALTELFARSVTRHGTRTALIFGDTALTYDDLDRRSSTLATAIADRVPAAACVGMLLDRSADCVVAELAILKAGCIFVPLDPAQPEALLAHILDDSGCALVLTGAGSDAALPDRHRALALDMAATGDTTPLRTPAPDDVTYIIYTSGSTGLPKGCLVTHRNAVRLLANDALPIRVGPDDVWLCAHSFAFDFSIWEVWGALAHGGCVIVADGDAARDPAALLALVRRHRVTILNQTPVAFYGLIEAEAAQPKHDLGDHLHTVIFGGDRLETAYLRRWVERYPLDAIALVNMYGITETTVHVSWHRIVAADLEPALNGGRSPIGRPLPETTIHVLDPNQLPQPIGVPGELWIGGGGVCRGYLDRADLTADRFVELDGRRLYRSGDIGRLRADGVLDYLGRGDGQVQVRGHRIELAGVQHWLLTHRDVDQAVVVARPDADGRDALIAYVVGGAGTTPDDQALRDHLACHLPAHAVPARFVVLDALPRTANGKLDRAALPAPDALPPTPAPAERRPRTAVETAIAAAWAEILRTPEIGIDRNFFSLGGDSIKALQIVARLHQAGIAVTLAQLLRAKTIAALAATVEERTAPTTHAALDAAPLTPIQHWFVETHGGAGHFNNAALLAADRIDADALQRAVDAVVQRHDGLRLTLDLTAVPPVQRIAPDITVTVEHVGQTSAAALTAHAARAQAEFDIGRAPLLRVIHYVLPDGERLLLLCHHLVIDGVSWRILLADLLGALRAAETGAAIALAPTGRWADWAAAQADAARASALLAEIPYWQQVESAEIAGLPCDFDDPVNAVRDVRTIEVALDDDATAALAGTVEDGGILAHLLAAVAIATRDVFGLDRLRVRLEGHGREDVADGLDLTRTIGWFTSIFPVLVDARDGEDRAAAATRIGTMLATVPRKGVGYGMLRYLTPPECRSGLRFAAPPEIGVNYLGHFDSRLDDRFMLANEPTGPLLDPALRRPELIAIEAAIVGGRLQIAVEYGERLHTRATIERFAAALREALVPEDGIEADLPLSPLQEGMYFHALSGDRTSYVQQFSYRISGPLNVIAYREAWQMLVARHQALRAAIVAAPGEPPRQRIARHRPIAIAVEDLRALAEHDLAAAIEALAVSERAGFDLAEDPLIRVRLVRCAEHETHVILTQHHIISDGWSLGIMMADLGDLYRALVAGRQPALLPAPPLSLYLDWLAAQDDAAARRFWTHRLLDAPVPVALGRAVVADAPYDMAEHSFAFDAAATRRLEALAAGLDVTLNSAVQALWATLLAGLSGSDDVVFGTIASGRPADLPGVDRMVGLFLQPAPVRVRIAGDSFASLARRLQRDSNDAAPYGHFPLAEMQRLGGTRRTLFDHVLVFENYPFADASNDDLWIGEVRAVEQMHFDYSLVVQPGDRLDIKFTFDRNVIDAAEFDRIEAQWRTLLAAVLDDADRPLAGIGLGTTPDPVAVPAIAGTVLDLFAAQVADRPDAVAIDDRGRTIAYRTLDARAGRLAGALAARGVRRGDRVASFLPAGTDHVATMLAAWKLAAVFVPVDMDAPERRLQLLARAISPVAWVTSTALRKRLTPIAGMARDRALAWKADGTIGGVTDGSVTDMPPVAGDAAYVMFTSGSTGTPKPILASHAGLRHFIDWEAAELEIEPGTRVAGLAPPTFDVSLRDIFLPLATGGTLCVPPDDARRDGTALVRWLAGAEVAVAHVVPSIFRLALAALEQAALPLPHVRHLLFAGEILRGTDVARVRALLGDRVSIRNLYGPSETTLAKFCHVVDGPIAQARAVPVGRPLPGTRVTIVKDGRPAAPGAIGELFIAPPFPPLGYLGDTALTAERFAEHPDWGDGLYYRTGDLGRSFADGTIEVCGRLDGQVKVNGVRVEVGEVEHAVLASEEIDAAVAVAHKREDGELALACYYTLNAPLDPADLRLRIALDLPAAIVPHFLVPLDALPLGLNGKVDRRALPRPEELVTGRIAFVAPEGAAETRIAAIWAEILGLKRVGACTPFFDLGGDSLRAIRVLTRTNAEFGGTITIGAFFAAPTVRDMAAMLLPAAPPAPPVRHTRAAADNPASHAERRLWILAQLGGNPAAYVLSAAYLLDGALNAAALVGALEALPARHEALRTVFVRTDQGVRQRLIDAAAFRVTSRDLTDAPDPPAAAAALAATNAATGFDLEHGPLLEASLLRIAADRHVLLVAVHHIVSDAQSVTVMIEETVRRARGETPPPLRLQLKDHAASEAAWLDTPDAAHARAWWHDQLRDPPERLNLPFDRLPPASPSYDGDRVSTVLDPGTVAALRALASRAGTTLFAALTALAAALLRRHTGAAALMLGMPVTRRDDPDLEGQIGCYVNLLPLRIDLADDDDAGGLVRRVGAVIAAAIDHCAYPFDRLVEELHLASDDARPPVFDVAMVFQDAGQRRFHFDGVAVTPFGDDPKVAKYPLTFEFVEEAHGVVLNLEYATDLFDADRIERMAGHFARLAEAAAADPGARLAALDIFEDEERGLLVSGGTVIDLDEPATIPASFAGWVGRQPDAPAVIAADTCLSYAELDARARALARALAARGIRRGDVVAVMLDRSEQLVIAFMGVLMAGAVYLPLDPTYPSERLEMMLADSAARLLLVQGKAESLGTDVASADLAELLSIGTILAVEPAGPASSDLAYLIYTSGSTGRPKGVLLEHRGAASLALAQRADLGVLPSDRVVQFAPSSFDASVWEMVMALLNGACLVVADAAQVRDPRLFAACLADHRVTIATLPPSYLAELDDQALAPLRLLITAGEAPDAGRMMALASKHDVVNAYGPTEATVCASWHKVDPARDAARDIPIGRAIPNTSLLVLDRLGNPTPIGVVGEVHVGGAGLARGYLDRPALTRQAFVPHPFITGERLYRTGDRGAVGPDGSVAFAGRIDRQVKLRGHRVELPEVERAISRLAGIDEAAVALRRGPASDELVAFVVIEGRHDLDAAKQALAQRLPSHMLPSRWVLLDALPKMPNGKIDHAGLPDEPAPFDESAAFDDPREQVVAEAWRTVLGHDRFGRHDRFVAVGGDSIRAIQVVSLLRTAGHAVEMRTFLALPTISGVAAALNVAPMPVSASARLDARTVAGLFADD